MTRRESRVAISVRAQPGFYPFGCPQTAMSNYSPEYFLLDYTTPTFASVNRSSSIWIMAPRALRK